MKPSTNKNVYCIPLIGVLIIFVITGHGIFGPLPQIIGQNATAVTQPPERTVPVAEQTYTAPAAIPAIAATMNPVPEPTKTRDYSNSQYGITLSYPSTWKLAENSQLSRKDYGRQTLTLTTIQSPENDPAILSIDIDPDTATDLENYFNRAVLALQVSHPHGWESTKHNAQLKVSDNFAYRIDYTITPENTVRNDYGIEVFTIVRGSPYIITFKGSEAAYKNHLGDFEDILKSIRLTSSATTVGQGS